MVILSTLRYKTLQCTVHCSLNFSIPWLQVSVEVKEGGRGEPETYNLRRRFWYSTRALPPTRRELNGKNAPFPPPPFPSCLSSFPTLSGAWNAGKPEERFLLLAERAGGNGQREERERLERDIWPRPKKEREFFFKKGKVSSFSPFVRRWGVSVGRKRDYLQSE